MIRRRAGLLVPVLAAALLLTGCTESGDVGPDPQITEAYQQWTDPTTDPVVFSGPTIDGARFESKQHLGEVVVVNFWYAGCGPCRAEAPTLKTLADEFAADGVQFVGVNTYDSKGTAQGFESTFRPGYPSILDQAGGAAVQLAFAAARPPKDIPSTLVLDRKGRVTARVSGLANESILKTLIQDAVDGKAS